MIKLPVFQEWIEDEYEKSGWSGCGWVFADGTLVPESLEVTVLDTNKFYNPIEGYVDFDDEGGDPSLRLYESLDEVREQARESGKRLRTFFGADGQRYPEDDGTRPLSDDEFNRRMVRTSGDMICDICGLPYWKHPDETRILGVEDRPFTKRLCNGTFGKL